MSQIDVYRHQCVGMIRCGENKDSFYIPIYRVDEDAEKFNAKAGDIIVGGGNGETAAMRISMPDTIKWLTDDEYDMGEDPIEAFWDSSLAYVFGIGYAESGWKLGEGTMEWFVADHVVAFLVKTYPEIYSQYVGDDVEIKRDGSICRLPTDKEYEIGMCPAKLKEQS